MNVVVTSLLTATPDPQRGTRWPADTPINDLHESLWGCEMVVFHDAWPTPKVVRDDATVNVVFLKVTPAGNPYTHRWRLLRDWLRASPAVEYVWAVDATDVEMLHDPWDQMQPDTLYVGSEPGPMCNQWMIRHHPAHREFVHANADRRLLNSGIAGGDRRTMLDFSTQLCDRLDEVETIDDYDMGAFNAVATAYGPTTGSPVHTVFRAEDRSDSLAWWRHK